MRQSPQLPRQAGFIRFTVGVPEIGRGRPTHIRETDLGFGGHACVWPDGELERFLVNCFETSLCPRTTASIRGGSSCLIVIPLAAQKQGLHIMGCTMRSHGACRPRRDARPPSRYWGCGMPGAAAPLAMTTASVLCSNISLDSMFLLSERHFRICYPGAKPRSRALSFRWPSSNTDCLHNCLLSIAFDSLAQLVRRLEHCISHKQSRAASCAPTRPRRPRTSMAGCYPARRARQASALFERPSQADLHVL